MVILGGWVFLMSEVPLYTGLFPQNPLSALEAGRRFLAGV